jgi:hypothetical protein
VIAWREKTAAFAVHFLVTLTLSAAAAALVFLVWYPEPFQKMLGGTKLFEVMVTCDLGLGPLTSFIIYSSRKSRRALLFDYTVIGILQLGAFLYGLYAVANTRPAYLVFVVDQIEVVSAGQLDDVDLAQGAAGFRQRPKWGPQLIGIQRPADPKQRQKVLWSSVMAGKDYPQLPRYYVPYEQVVLEVKQKAAPVSELEKRHPEAKPLVASTAARLRLPVEKLLWLPVKHRSGFWTALLDPDTGRPVSWLPVDPD